MKNKFGKLTFVIVVALSLCCGAIAAYATKCVLKCLDCGSRETNHYHPDGKEGCWVFCRDCGKEWYEANPKQE
ncbi:MAG: hypothetical protein Q4C26_04545 [Bacteroidales bacterium]|nr:hypothetical protein [Bacteroidales bacterium]